MCFLGRWGLAGLVFKKVPCFSRVLLFQWAFRRECRSYCFCSVFCCVLKQSQVKNYFFVFSRAQKYVLSFIWPLHISKRLLLDKRSRSRWLFSEPCASPKTVTLSWWGLKWRQMLWVFWGPLLFEWKEHFFFKGFLYCTFNSLKFILIFLLYMVLRNKIYLIIQHWLISCIY